jgi:DNA-binding NarL/FixJ family response regulator
LIRIMLVDDHAAVRAGLETVLHSEPDLVPVTSTDAGEDLWPRFHQTRPDLVLLDFHLPGRNSLVICRRLKAVIPPPKVAFYSAYADASLGVPLRLAGADGLVSKGAPATELFEAIRRIAADETVLPPLTADLIKSTCGPLPPDDRVLTGLLLNGASIGDVVDVLGGDTDAARTRVERLLGRVVPGDPRGPASVVADRCTNRTAP